MQLNTQGSQSVNAATTKILNALIFAYKGTLNAKQCSTCKVSLGVKSCLLN